MKKQPAAVTSPRPGSGGTLSPGLRRYVYATAALTGGCIMIVEILGAKMLAPYVGTSHFVWTAQIAITLVALAAGYYAGGSLVDRSPRLGRLYACILAGAVYLGATTLAVKPVAYACLRFDLAVGTLLASATLYFVPLALMAMVGPFMVRMLTDSVAGVGGNVGRLTALSTLGSFAGTVLIGYVLIPLLPNSVTMVATAALLCAVCLGYFFGWGREGGGRSAAVTFTVLGLSAAAFGMRADLLPPRHVTERFRANSNFGLLQVFDETGGRRYYLNDFLTQNIYDPARKQSAALFTYMLHGLSRLYTPRIDRALCIGMGVGIVPGQFAREGVPTDVVEINPAVVPLARDFFDLPATNLNITIGDGRWFVNQCTTRYDTIVLDAFLGDSSPSHLMTREAFESMKRILRPGGTLVINAFGNFAPGRDYFTASLDKTLRTVFRSVRIHAEDRGEITNVFFVASDAPDLQPGRKPEVDVHPAVRSQVRTVYDSVLTTDPESGIVLTDDYNPVDFHDALNRETTRRHLATTVSTL